MYLQELVPVPGHEAFLSADPAAVHSQAAFLLTLARQGRRQGPVTQGQIHSDDAETEEVGGVDPDDEDAEALAIPVWEHPAALDAGLAMTRVRRLKRPAVDARAQRRTSDDAARLADALYDSPGADAALDLIEACLDAPHPLVRVAAAAADLRLDLEVQGLLAHDRRLPPSSIYAGDPLVRTAAARRRDTVDDPDDHPLSRARLPLPRRSTEILMRGTGEQDELVRDVAVSALEGARFHFENLAASAPASRDSSDEDPPAPKRPETSIVIHGTFARWSGWWKPGRVFPKYLKANVAPNLYGGSQPFHWSGIYSHDARELGAGDLAAWARGRPLDQVFAHSHGGTVAMLASQGGVRFKKLVLLSCPVHARYAPAFTHICKVVSVRTRLDLAILADGGRQRFRDPRIHEHVLPLWFRHSATRQPDVWREHSIDAML